MFSHLQYSHTSSAHQVTEFVLVEYPGVIKNVQKSLETLGGIRTLSNAHFNNTPLELQFRPDNPFHSSMIAERRNQSAVFSGNATLVLRIRRRKRRENDGKLCKEEGEKAEQQQQLDICCIGMVSTIYSFRNICDFQFLPLSNTTTFDTTQRASVHHDLIPRLVPTDFPSSLNWWDEQQQRYRKKLVELDVRDELTTSPAGEQDSLDMVSYLPPYQYSRYNTPSKFILHDDIERWTKKTTEGVGHGKSLRNERKALTVTVNYNDPFPEAPSEKAIQDVKLRCKNAEVHKMFVELFAERPLWSRLAISYRTRLTDAMLKIVLAKYAFYINSGPWGRLWCRFGYDPRKDPWARCFQSIMVSFKKNQYIPERLRLKAATSSAVGAPLSGLFLDYVYRPRVLPPLRQMWYCVCDVMLPIAQKICRKDCLETLKEYNPDEGWLPAHRIDAIRAAIKADVAMSSARIGEEQDESGMGGTIRGGVVSDVGGSGEDDDDDLDMTMMEEEEEGMDEDEESGRMMAVEGEMVIGEESVDVEGEYAQRAWKNL